MNRYTIHHFPEFIDQRGSLIPFELNDDFPFKVKRVYLVTAKNNQSRGGHAHRIESELFIAAQGTVKAKVNANGNDEVITLDKKNKALEVAPFCWHEFYDFSEDAILLCFSSTHYLPGETNYITDKAEFLNNFKA
ncbi:WxcM-like domain-containing protein [bacterium]|nr:WxcM-like domain-containing protein [bacterium]NCQ55045.1 WxcM-like domain-containing protein [Candidatus Parcubacteria bacterium]NCS67089.1 WxcM-like domain-containing protein [Candidatus Peregrinibacteria bacterium]NCS96035.1 WxcM-like domain-containing protein [bacterium]